MQTYRKPQTKQIIARTVSTYSYRAVHGEFPKGFGKWNFIVQTSVGNKDFTFTANYGEAKEAAINFAKSIAGPSVQIITISVEG